MADKNSKVEKAKAVETTKAEAAKNEGSKTEAMSTSASTKPAVDSIIRKWEHAEETANERLLRKHLPAWVISGALNLGLVSSALVFDRLSTKPVVQAQDSIIETSIEEKAEDARPEDLTNKDLGFDSEIPLTTTSDIKADVTIEAPDAPSEPVGTPSANQTTPMDFTAPPGVGPVDLANAGFAGDAGNLLQGVGGLNGTVVNTGMAGRSGATKEKLLKEGGGNSESERAVAVGIAWLAKQQLKNGSWVYKGNGAHNEEIAASTGMALLPFLAAGQTHKLDPKARVDYHEVVAKGIAYLISIQDPNTGVFRVIDPDTKKLRTNSNMYAQAIATVALCEAYGMTRDKSKLLGPCQKAIRYIEKMQGPDGSWNYFDGSNGDTSIVGWQIQALSSAERCQGDLVVNKAVMEKARKFLEKIYENDKKGFGYRLDKTEIKASPTTSLTAIGLLSRYYTDWGRGDLSQNTTFVTGAKNLLNGRPPSIGIQDPYYYYYASQVLHFHGGAEWNKWNEEMRTLLVGSQVKSGENAGSWSDTNDQFIFTKSTGRLGVTCMSLLTLEVYYRHLPLNKRSEGGARDVDRTR